MKRRGTTQLVGRKTKRLYGRFWLGQEKRESVPLPGVDKDDDKSVAARCGLIADVAEKLVQSGRPDKARDIAVQLGAAKSAKQIDAVLAGVRVMVESARVVGAGITVQQLGRRWTSGDLARTFPDHVKKKATAGDDAQLLEHYVYPVIGPMALRLMQLENGEDVMARLPQSLSPARRRHVAQAMHRLLALAVYPAKIIKTHPFPKGFLPKLGPPKAKQSLYPDEDAKLLACTRVPLVWRLFYGVLDREGLRFDEARSLDWSDLDLERGAVKLDINKTNDPRAWALDRGVVAALQRWRDCRPGLARPFQEIPNDEHQAERLRDDVRMAGVTRPALFETTDQSLRLRCHDLRATFVTVSLANGKSETWVSDRTGHKSSTMIAKYRRAARTYAELGLGALSNLANTIVWEEEPSCQTSVKTEEGRGGSIVSLEKLKNKLSTEGGTRTLTPCRAADFESAIASSQHPNSLDIKRGRVESQRAARRLDSVLTEFNAQRRQWSAFETFVEAMDPEAGAS